MEYISVTQYAEKYGVSERTARNYCACGKIDGAFLTGKTWNIPADAGLPKRATAKKKVSPLLAVLREQMSSRLKGGIYHRTQIDLTYNSNHIEGSRLTHEQTRYIFETNTIGITDAAVNVDDIVETINHFRIIDYIIEHAEEPVTEHFVKQLHLMLKMGTSDSQKDWFAVGEYKRLANEVGGQETCPPKEVHRKMKALVSRYNRTKQKTLEDIVDFHVCFERIHPFQDGNGRIGRLLMFKECLANGIVPFIITDDIKMFYYRGLREWGHVNGYMMDTCRTAQDQYKAIMEYFGIRETPSYPPKGGGKDRG
ncbi:MAG: Fic family protein [Bacteroidaceae bacterium]|nr:Fic family protein [Bacteroidaceae bacterium]